MSQPRSRPLLAGALALLFCAHAATTAAADAGTAPKLKNGALCEERPRDAFEGETHRCWFSPQRFGKRDFSTRNARAQFVVTELAPDCDEIEILGDGPSPLQAADGGELKQLSIRCTP